MSCWALLVERSWLWWLLVAQVLGVGMILALGVGYLLGADRWTGRRAAPQRQD
jgi:hypothetical protein